MINNTQDKSLQIVNNKNTIFQKIKNFFKSLFSKKENTCSQQNIVVYNDVENVKEDFVNSLKFDMELIELQKKLKIGDFKIKDLSIKQKHSMIELYENQIAEKKNKLKNLKIELSFYKNNISTQ